MAGGCKPDNSKKKTCFVPRAHFGALPLHRIGQEQREVLGFAHGPERYLSPDGIRRAGAGGCATSEVAARGRRPRVHDSDHLQQI